MSIVGNLTSAIDCALFARHYLRVPLLFVWTAAFAAEARQAHTLRRLRVRMRQIGPGGVATLGNASSILREPITIVLALRAVRAVHGSVHAPAAIFAAPHAFVLDKPFPRGSFAVFVGAVVAVAMCAV